MITTDRLKERKNQILKQLEKTPFSGDLYTQLITELKDLKSKWIEEEVKPYLEKIEFEYENN